MNHHIENITNSTLNSVKSFIIKQSLNPGEASFLFYFKLFSFFVILLITFSFGLLPIFFAKYRQTTILNYANPFAGGVFIGIGLFHLLPEASYDFENYYKSKEGSTSFFYGFPMSYFIAFLSYSFILYLEKVAFSTDEKKDNENNKDKNDLIDEEYAEPLLKKESDVNDNNNIDNEGIGYKDNYKANNNDEKINNSLMYKRNKDVYTKKQKEIRIANRIRKDSEEYLNNNFEIKSEENKDINENEEILKQGGITPYILLLALSLHGIFEGIALGVLNHRDEVIMLFIAIVAHKWAESFALGISFYKAKIETSIFLKMLTIFSFFTPLGILIGMYFSKSGFLIEGIMLSISSGTFLYVSTSEVIVEEFSSKGSKHVKYWCYLIGGFLPVLLFVLEPSQNVN